MELRWKPEEPRVDRASLPSGLSRWNLFPIANVIRLLLNYCGNPNGVRLSTQVMLNVAPRAEWKRMDYNILVLEPSSKVFCAKTLFPVVMN